MSGNEGKSERELDLEAQIEILTARLQIAEASQREASAMMYRAQTAMARVSECFDWDGLRKSIEGIRELAK